jgi:hypothetical protein
LHPTKARGINIRETKDSGMPVKYEATVLGLRFSRKNKTRNKARKKAGEMLRRHGIVLLTKTKAKKISRQK